MVSQFIEPLKACGAGCLTPGGRLLAWATVVTDSAYSALAVNRSILVSKFLTCSISSVKLDW